MDVTLEYLKIIDLKAYRSLLADVLGEVVEMDVMVSKFQENHPSFKVVVAKNGSEMLGTTSFAMIDSFTGLGDPKIEFSNFAVAKAARGTNVATLLMDFVINYAKEYGYQSIVVNCGVDAHRAHAFYEKMGFERAEKARFVLAV